MTTIRFLTTAFLGGLAGTILLIAYIFATGQSFGQRCDRMFPNDGARQELCVENLAAGRAP